MAELTADGEALLKLRRPSRSRSSRRQWADGRSLREVALACGVGSTTVRDGLARAKAMGLEWPLAEDLDDAAREAKPYARPEEGRDRPLPEPTAVCRELKRRGVTLELL